ncbi:hypothetical protein L1887_23006 [Cichorium endivia]|nr:hypothetical protein L1887_23006 [Cichorium endivia]
MLCCSRDLIITKLFTCFKHFTLYFYISNGSSLHHHQITISRHHHQPPSPSDETHLHVINTPRHPHLARINNQQAYQRS